MNLKQIKVNKVFNVISLKIGMLTKKCEKRCIINKVNIILLSYSNYFCQLKEQELNENLANNFWGKPRD